MECSVGARQGIRCCGLHLLKCEDVVWHNYDDTKKNIEEKKNTKALNARIRPEVKYQKVSQSALSPYLLKPQGK